MFCSFHATRIQQYACLVFLQNSFLAVWKWSEMWIFFLAISSSFPSCSEFLAQNLGIETHNGRNQKIQKPSFPDLSRNISPWNTLRAPKTGRKHVASGPGRCTRPGKTCCFWSHQFVMGMAQNLVTLVNIKIARKWMFIPLKMVFIGIDPWPHQNSPSLVPFHVRNSHPHVVPQTPGFFGARWAPGHLIQELRVHALGAFPQPLHRALQDGQPQDLEMWRGRSPEIDRTWHGARDFLKRSWDIKWYKPAKNGWNWLIIWSDVLLSILQQQKNKRIVGWALGRSRIKVRITILARAEKTRIIYTVYYDD